MRGCPACLQRPDRCRSRRWRHQAAYRQEGRRPIRRVPSNRVVSPGRTGVFRLRFCQEQPVQPPPERVGSIPDAGKRNAWTDRGGPCGRLGEWNDNRGKLQWTKQYRSEALAVAHETALGLTEAGVMSKRTMRAFDEACLTPVVEMTPEQIRELRLRERASQAVFARYLNVTTGLVSQWGARRKAAKGCFVEAADPGGEERPGCCCVTASTMAARSVWITEPNPRNHRNPGWPGGRIPRRPSGPIPRLVPIKALIQTTV